MVLQAMAVRGTSPQSRWLFTVCTLEVATMLPFLNFSAAQALVRQDWVISAAQAGSVLGSYQLGYVALAFGSLALLTGLGVLTLLIRDRRTA